MLNKSKDYGIKQVKDLFIFPNMGDGGLSVGAAILEYFNKTNRDPKIEKLLLGLKYSEAEIIKKKRIISI